MKKIKAAQIILGIGLGLTFYGGMGLDSLDMTRPVIICFVGLFLMFISIPFLRGDSESEEDSIADCNSDYSRNYPYDKTFRKR